MKTAWKSNKVTMERTVTHKKDVIAAPSRRSTRSKDNRCRPCRVVLTTMAIDEEMEIACNQIPSPSKEYKETMPQRTDAKDADKFEASSIRKHSEGTSQMKAVQHLDSNDACIDYNIACKLSRRDETKKKLNATIEKSLNSSKTSILPVLSVDDCRPYIEENEEAYIPLSKKDEPFLELVDTNKPMSDSTVNDLDSVAASQNRQNDEHNTAIVTESFKNPKGVVTDTTAMTECNLVDARKTLPSAMMKDGPSVERSYFASKSVAKPISENDSQSLESAKAIDLNNNTIRRSERVQNEMSSRCKEYSEGTEQNIPSRILREQEEKNYNLSDLELNDSILEYSYILHESFDSDSELNTSFCCVCMGYDDPDFNDGTEEDKETEWVGCDCGRWYHDSCLTKVASHIGLHLQVETFNCEQINHNCIQQKEK